MRTPSIVRNFGCAFVYLIAILTFVSQQAIAAEATDPGRGAQPFAGKATGPWAKADTGLRELVQEFRLHQARGARESFQPRNNTFQYARGRVVIDAVAAGDADALLEDLRGMGLRNASRYGSIVSGSFPLGAVNRMLELGSLRSVAASRKPLINVGQVTSEGVAAMYADLVHSDFDGTGVTVGAISDSYDQQGGAANDVANGDLPAGILVLDDAGDCGGACSDEGRAMMQLIYDVAPGSSLAFHTAFGGIAGFANGIEELAAAGADIIVDDVIYFAEPMYQDGAIARAVDNVVGQGVAYFSSAGNFARQSYESGYVSSGEPFDVSGDPRGVLHDFDPGPGTDWAQSIDFSQVPPGAVITIVMQWDEPFASLSSGGNGSTSDMDIYLIANGNVLAAQSIDNNIASGEPIEVLQVAVQTNCAFYWLLGAYCVEPTVNDVYIAHFDGPAPGKMKYVIYDRSVTLEYPTYSSTLYGHANAAGAQAVGAAFYQATPAFCDGTDGVAYNDCDMADGVDTATLEGFSAAGGTANLFDNDGNRLAQPVMRVKPGVVGPDGTNTTFFYSDSSTDPDTWPNFFGTSAAAPHVAGVAALMLQANPGLAPADVYAALESTALNMNPRPEGSAEDADGFDFDTGYGFVQADLAVAAVLNGPVNQPPVAAFGFNCTDLTCTFDASGSSDADGTVVSYDWDFGDGNAASGPTVQHTFAAGGTFTVVLTVTDDDGGSDTDSQAVSVSAPGGNQDPTADPGGDNGNYAVRLPGGRNPTGSVTLDGSGSSDPDGNDLAFEWRTVGGGAVGADAVTTVSGLPQGKHEFVLTVSDGLGGVDTASACVEMYKGGSPAGLCAPTGGPSAPAAAFSESCADLTCDFTDQSSDSDGSVVSWSWSFGDGAGSVAQHPSHTYDAAGTYTVTLTVTDNDGLSDSSSHQVTVGNGGGSQLQTGSVNNGPTWTAIVSTSDGSPDLSGTWVYSGGTVQCDAPNAGTCSLGGIAKKEASVEFTSSQGETVTVFKP